MLRVIAFHLAVFALPFVAYAAYVYFVRRPAPTGGIFEDAPLFWLSVTGLAMTITVFIVVAVFSGSEPGGVYEPPRLRDGVVVPGRIVPPDTDSAG